MRARRGFSVAEMIIAMFLLAIAVSTIAYLIPFSTRANSKAAVLAVALFWGQERMEEALSRPDAPAEVPDPQDPSFIGSVERGTWPEDDRMILVKVKVYRAGDAAKTPIVQLETLVGGG